MRRRLSLACLLVAWFCANGAVWDVVQVVAWGRMFADYSDRLPTWQAVAKTFNGTAPCAMCRAVSRAKESARHHLPREAALGADQDRLLLAAEDAPAMVVIAPAAAWTDGTDRSGDLRTEAVPVPPPRV